MSVRCCEIDVRPQVLLGRKLCLKLLGCLTLLSSIFLGWVKSLTELSRVMEEVYYRNLQIVGAGLGFYAWLYTVDVKTFISVLAKLLEAGVR